MSSSGTFLNFHYGLSRKSSSLQPKPSLQTPRQNSILPRGFQPNIEEMRRVFDKYDVNKDGKISKDEYALALRTMGLSKAKSSEVSKAFQLVDTDGDGFIDFEEFIKVHKMDGGVKTGDIQSAFRVFDLDGNGKISAQELLEVLRRLGERSNLEACRKMVRGVDANGDGMIDMDEFMSLMTHTLKLV